MINLKNRYSRILVLILIAGVVIGGYYWWNQRQIEKPTSLQKISFATVPSMVEVPSHVAYHNNFFEDEGLDVNLVFTHSGNLSLERLLNGEFDFATVTGTPVVHKSFVRDDFYIIGDIVHPVEHLVLARKDKGIKSPADLKGEKLAVMKGASADSFIDFFSSITGWIVPMLKLSTCLPPIWLQP
jgi:ABC-type nitrate/sulfonate/bicarbonate transport system substrate-binding protein